METSTSTNEVIASHDTSPPRTVRTNWLQFAWSQVSGATKVLLVVSTIISLIQIITTVVILVLGGHDDISCDKPLQLYLIVFIVRVGISLPLSIYQHLFVTRRRINSNNRRQQQQHQPEETPSSTTNTTTENTTTTTTTTEADTSIRSHHRPSTLVSGWAERLKSLLDLFAILWFIVGNYLVFSSSICSSSAALYYYTILTWILFGYTILVIPLLACASVIFCLPCVLVTMRMFNINVSNVMKGGTKEELAKIPVYKFKASDDSQVLQPTTETEQQQQTITTTTTTTTMKKGNYFRRWMKRRKNDSSVTTTDIEAATVNNYPYLSIPRIEDAVCSICLSEYENDELVCKLWCEHHYHESCVTEWLALNTKCPLCKRDFRGKDYVDQDSSDEGDQV